jgi:hypothetical protein
MTDVRILDFNFTRYINFEAHVQFPEEGDIVQVWGNDDGDDEYDDNADSGGDDGVP